MMAMLGGTSISGVGLGFRRDIAEHLISDHSRLPHFVELAPENWMNIGGHWGKTLRQIAEIYPITCHGLSLSLGSPDPLDWDLLKRIKVFLGEFKIAIYSEHLSYSKCNNAHLYDLLPIPFRSDAVRHVAQRIREVQDFLERTIAIENVAYYTPVAPEMSESDFLTAVVNESCCALLLDINNVYVNAFNHNYNAKEFINSLPLNRVAYIHMAGHEQRSADLIIDSHGQPIIDPVFELFDWSLDRIAPVPVLLERDFNLGDFPTLRQELERLAEIVEAKWEIENAA